MRQRTFRSVRWMLALVSTACWCAFVLCLSERVAAQDAQPSSSRSQHSLAEPSAESQQTQRIAEKLQNCTVTVRILHHKPPARAAGGTPAASQTQTPDAAQIRDKDLQRGSQPQPPTTEITVCSGVVVGSGFGVAHDDIRESRTAAADRYRITLPDGKQAAARLAVIDQYSQLHLLKIDQPKLVGIAISPQVPKVGARIMAGAAAGIDKAVVSIGIVGAVDRSLPGVYFPPLVQCDIRSLETSTGGAIVDLNGQLVGVVTFTDPPEKRNGWTYAVPASQVARLLRAQVAGELIVMSRRRPLVGMKLSIGEEPGVCVVERVTQGGPADQAGIKPGDIVQEAAGRKIRSPYQAVRQVMNRQPGDKITLLVERNKSTTTVDITLAGGALTPVDDSDVAKDMGLVEQNVNVKRAANGGYEVADHDRGVRIVPGQRAPLKMSLDRVESLERQVALYRQEAAQLRKQLHQRDAVQADLQKLIAQMLHEIREMKAMQEAEGKAEKPSAESSR